jgi:hypothetical protein
MFKMVSFILQQMSDTLFGSEGLSFLQINILFVEWKCCNWANGLLRFFSFVGIRMFFLYVKFNNLISAIVSKYLKFFPQL